MSTGNEKKIPDNSFVVQTWTLRNELLSSFEETLRELLALKVSRLEVASTGRLGHEIFGKYSADLGFENIAVHHAALDCTESSLLLDEFKKSCEELSTKTIVVSYSTSMPRTESNYDRYAELFLKFKEQLLPKISLVYHCYAFDLIPINSQGDTGLDAMMSELRDSGEVSVELDAYYTSKAKKDFNELFNEYHKLKLCFGVHLNESGPSGEHVPVGTGSGKFDWAKLVSDLHHAGSHIIIEHNSDSPLEDISTSLSFLRGDSQ